MFRKNGLSRNIMLQLDPGPYVEPSALFTLTTSAQCPCVCLSCFRAYSYSSAMWPCAIFRSDNDTRIRSHYSNFPDEGLMTLTVLCQRGSAWHIQVLSLQELLLQVKRTFRNVLNARRIIGKFQSTFDVYYECQRNFIETFSIAKCLPIRVSDISNSDGE